MANITPPEITTAAVQSIAENTTVAAALTSMDDDLEGLNPAVFSIVADFRDGAKFIVANGNLVFITAPDFEAPADADGNNSYIVRVRAFDGANETLKDITVSVTDSTTGVVILGTANNDTINASSTVPGQRFPTNEADTIIGNAGADTMAAGAGDDTYLVDNVGDRISEAANGGTDKVFASVSYVLQSGQHIEQMIASAGTTGLTLTGNALANQLQSGAGNDTLVGGRGDDNYIVNNVGDRVREAANAGTDKVFATVSYALQAGQSIEQLIANAGNKRLTLTGNELANQLQSGAGIDTLVGGRGDDTYFVNNAGDRARETSGAGTDKVFARVSYALQAGQAVEQLIASAGKTALTLTGNELANQFQSGAGIDTLVGGRGDDNYLVNNAADRVREAAGGGADKVFAAVSYTLQAGQSIEQLIANAGKTRLTLTGNELANRIESGGGVDTLVGGRGNDSYIVNNTGDRVREAGGGGADLVFATVSYALQAGQSIEQLIASAGNTALTLTGNELANQLQSGAGIDTLVGGRGNDVYLVNNTSDKVREVRGAGSDTVVTSVSYQLAAGVSVERLQVLNPGSTNVINLTGNEIDNTLVGNDGANLIDGGKGTDFLRGEGGDDIFRFSVLPPNVDGIGDFSAADDSIQLDNAVFKALTTTGVLAAGAFNTGTAATQADDRIIYNPGNGVLFYDSNGSQGGGDVFQFALLSNKAKITHADFVVI
jgi:Ca2+-binding RTX toxin-like protein